MVESFQFWSPEEPVPDSKRTPVTLISGFLGSGKTTLLNHLLQHSQGRRLGILVNDLGSVNIDASLIREGMLEQGNSADGVVELSSGCICCSIQSQLMDAVVKLHTRYAPDHLIIEATGVAEPRAVLNQFHRHNLLGVRGVDFLRIHNAVTIVDAPSTLERLRAPRFQGAGKRTPMLMSDPRRPLDELVFEQIECADLVLINKSELVSTEELERITVFVRSLNPRAELHICSFGRVDPEGILNRMRFEEKATFGGAFWQQALKAGLETSAPASPGWSLQPNSTSTPSSHHDYGLDSFVYRARKPFRETPFVKLMRSRLPGVLRAKGFFWSDREPDKVGLASLAGSILRVDFLGPWWQVRFQQGEVGMTDLPELVRKVWVEPWGDRRQELVFIGVELDKELIINELESCLKP